MNNPEQCGIDYVSGFDDRMAESFPSLRHLGLMCTYRTVELTCLTARPVSLKLPWLSLALAYIDA